MAPTKGKGNGKKKVKGKGGNSKETESGAADPTSESECIFPITIIFNILSLLPVKNLLQFRCVCKQWNKIISKPNFIATHFRHSSSSLHYSGSSILIHTRHSESSDHVLSMYSPPEAIVELDNPYPCFFPNMCIVGPVNGIICLYLPPWGDVITLWNPATRRSRRVPLSGNKPVIGVHCWVSIGLAFDYEENDLLILRIFCEGMTSTDPNHVEMCSTKNLQWKKLKNELVCHIISHTNLGILKGVPYWSAIITDKFGPREVLVRFDVSRKVFENLPIPGTGERTNQDVVVMEDSLGMVTWEETDKCYIDVWVMDDEDGWSKKCKVGPLFGFDRILGCLRNGDIVAKNANGVLLFDPVTSSVKAKLDVGNAKKGSYLIFEYSESLVLIGGMQIVKKQDPKDKARKDLIREIRDFMQRL